MTPSPSPPLGTLTRATAGRDHTQCLSVWEMKETYRVKVLSTENVNVAENHKVRYSELAVVDHTPFSMVWYCTLVVTLCSISYNNSISSIFYDNIMANHPISRDIGQLDDRKGHLESWVVCTTCNKFLIEWVAIPYHWTLDSPCLYLARPMHSLKYITDSSNIQ